MWPQGTRGDKKGKGSPAILKNVRLATTQTFLFHFYRAMLCIRGTSHDPVTVRLSVRLSVCLSVRHKSVFY